MAAERRTRESIPWIFVEGFAIVFGILLAFSIDAWWDEMREEEDVQRMLIAVHDDLRNSKSTLDYDRELSNTRQNAINTLLEASFDKDADVSGLLIDGLLGELLWYRADFIIADAGISSLIFSGTFGAINSEEIRRDLASWPANKEYMQHIFDTHKQFLDNVWWPYMRNNGFQPQILRTGTYRLGHPSDAFATFPLSRSDKFDHRPLLNDEIFQNLLAQYWSIQVDISIAYENADGWLDHSIRLLEEELEIVPQPGLIFFDVDAKSDKSQD